MTAKTISSLAIFFLCALYINSLLHSEIALANQCIEHNSIEPLRSKIPSPHGTYDAFTSKKKKFIYFRIFKAASGTLTHFFRDQVADLKQSHPSKISQGTKDYFKFAFVRNPWDRIVSCYFHKVVTKADPSFARCFDKSFDFFVDYIASKDLTTANRHLRLQTRLIPYQHCDFIGKIDNFAEDLQYISDHLGLEMIAITPRHKTEHDHYSAYYTPRTRKIIARKYREDIEVFGFKFETE